MSNELFLLGPIFKFAFGLDYDFSGVWFGLKWERWLEYKDNAVSDEYHLFIGLIPFFTMHFVYYRDLTPEDFDTEKPCCNTCCDDCPVTGSD